MSQSFFLWLTKKTVFTQCYTRKNTSTTGMFTCRRQGFVRLTSTPWSGMSIRCLRNYPIKLLLRNQSFRKKGYTVEKEWSVGIELQPSEVKAIRERNADISASFGEFYRHELFLHQMHVPVWRCGLIGRPEPMRVRKLLANRAELKKMEDFMKEPNAQLIPLRIEVGVTGWIKIILAQCRRINKVDNRKRDEEREAKRQIRDCW